MPEGSPAEKISKIYEQLKSRVGATLVSVDTQMTSFVAPDRSNLPELRIVLTFRGKDGKLFDYTVSFVVAEYGLNLQSLTLNDDDD